MGDDTDVRPDVYRRPTRHRLALIARTAIADTGATGVSDTGAVVRHARDAGHPAEVLRELGSVAAEILRGGWPTTTDIKEAEFDAWAEGIRRTASMAVRSQARDPEGSRIHGVPWLSAATPWPTSRSGRPLEFLAQFRLEDADPATLADLPVGRGLVSVFFEDGGSPDVLEDDSSVMLLDHGTEGGLREPPPSVRTRKERPLVFVAQPDHPWIGDAGFALPEGFEHETAGSTELGDRWRDLSMCRGTKIGGWATGIQRPPFPGLDLSKGSSDAFLLRIDDVDATTGFGSRSRRYDGPILVGVRTGEADGVRFVLDQQRT